MSKRKKARLNPEPEPESQHPEATLEAEDLIELKHQDLSRTQTRQKWLDQGIDLVKGLEPEPTTIVAELALYPEHHEAWTRFFALQPPAFTVGDFLVRRYTGSPLSPFEKVPCTSRNFWTYWTILDLLNASHHRPTLVTNLSDNVLRQLLWIDPDTTVPPFVSEHCRANLLQNIYLRLEHFSADCRPLTLRETRELPTDLQVLAPLIHQRAVLAGGAAFWSYHQRPSVVPSDVDLFILGPNPDQRQTNFKQLVLQLLAALPGSRFCLKPGVATIAVPGWTRYLQIIFTDCTTPEAVLKTFDLSIVKVGWYDGQFIWTRSAETCWASQELVVLPQEYQNPFRLRKWLQRTNFRFDGELLESNISDPKAGRFYFIPATDTHESQTDCLLGLVWNAEVHTLKDAHKALKKPKLIALTRHGYNHTEVALTAPPRPSLISCIHVTPVRTPHRQNEFWLENVLFHVTSPPLTVDKIHKPEQEPPIHDQEVAMYVDLTAQPIFTQLLSDIDKAIKPPRPVRNYSSSLRCKLNRTTRFTYHGGLCSELPHNAEACLVTVTLRPSFIKDQTLYWSLLEAHFSL